MKIVIIEGLDNTGKTTVINELMKIYNSVYYIHATKPDIKDIIKCALAQRESFYNMANNILSICNLHIADLVILDRSWVGEYVYGCMYRNNGEEFVRETIEECYNILFSQYNIDISTIVYTASPEFCISNDDGKSISKARRILIEQEKQRFNDIIMSSSIIGKKAIINVENEDGSFKDKKHILDMTLDVINAAPHNLPNLIYINDTLNNIEEKKPYERK